MSLRWGWIMFALVLGAFAGWAQDKQEPRAEFKQFAAALMTAADDAARARLLEQKRELVTPELVEAIDNRGKVEMKEKRQNGEARRHFQFAYQVAEKINDQKGRARELANLGVSYLRESQNDKALAYFKQSLPLYDRVDHPLGKADTLANLGLIYSSLDYRQAKEFYNQALAIYKTANDTIGIADVHRGLGMIDAGQSLYPSAVDHYKQALAAFEKANEQVQVEVTLLGLGNVYQAQGESKLAFEHYQKAYATQEKRGDKMQMGGTLFILGLFHTNQGEYEAALGYYQRSLRLREELKDDFDVAAVKKQIGFLYAQQGNFALALENYFQALALQRSLKAGNAEAQTLWDIGSTYSAQNNDRLALAFYEQALARFEAIGNLNRVPLVLTAMGGSYLVLGEFSQAQTHLNRAIALTEKNRDSNGQMFARQTLAFLFARQEKHQLAIEQFDQLIKLAQEMKDAYALITAYTGLGYAYAAQRKYTEALQVYKDYLQLAEAVKSQEYIADALQGLADVLTSKGDYAEAQAHATRAVAIARKYEKLPALSQSLYRLGEIYRKSQRPTEAEPAYREAIALAEKSRANVSGGDRETQEHFASQLLPYSGLMALLVEQKQWAEAFAIAETTKARVLLDTMQKGPVHITPTMTSAEQEREQQIKMRMVSLNAQIYQVQANDKPDTERLAALRSDLSQARGAFDTFQTQLYATHPELRLKRGGAKPLALPEANALLPDGKTALLEFASHDDNTLLFVLTKGASGPDLKVFTLPITRKDLATKVTTWQENMRRNSQAGATPDPDYHGALRAFYELLLKPAQAVLTGKTNLVIVPDGPLWELPFQALITSRDRYLLEEATISYAPSLTFLRDRVKMRTDKPATAPNRLLALGVGNFSAQRSETQGEELATLLDVKPTLQGISRFYAPSERQVLLDAQATEETFKTQASQYRILQFMTHGVLNNRSPMYSHIVLAQPGKNSKEDGFLEAWELMRLNLKADLAILGACDTGRGGISNGEGVIGLMWAFFVAGVPNTVVSQWSVNSAATKELMIEFHRQLTTKPTQSKAEALRQASLKLLRSEIFYHPYHWASFVMVGDGK